MASLMLPVVILIILMIVVSALFDGFALLGRIVKNALDRWLN